MNIIKLIMAFIMTVAIPATIFAKDTATVKKEIILNADNVIIETTDNVIKLTEGNNKKHKIRKNTKFTLKAENGTVDMSGNVLVPPLTFTLTRKKSQIKINDQTYEHDITVNLSSEGKLDIMENLPFETPIKENTETNLPIETPSQENSGDSIVTEKNSDEDTVRIAILLNTDNVTFNTTDNAIMVTEGNGKIHKITNNTSFILKAENGKLNMSGNKLVPPVTFNMIKKKGQIQIKDKTFVGNITVNLTSQGKIDIVEILPIKAYVMGVIRKEMGAGWPLEALKAQAVSARTYAYINMKPSQHYDLTADVRSQVYSAIENPEENVLKAVEQTGGLVLKDKSRIFDAFFHSYCGGMTETPDHVWSKTSRANLPSPLQHSVKDPYCTGTVRPDIKSWSVSVNYNTILNLAKKKNSRISKVSKLSIGRKNSSGRTDTLTATTNIKPVLIEATNLRNILKPDKMKSTFITSITRTKTGWIIKGKGFGHGVGMCQYGAKGMAEAGKNFMEILKFYYPGATIEDFYSQDQ